jgi:LPS export ABC transporter protein LptC
MLALLLAGCENDIERINLVTDEAETPILSGTNIEVIYSDSAMVKVQILAPSYMRFVNVERPYMDFPEGLECYFYDATGKIESDITADHAVYYIEDNLWHATGNVVAQRLDNGDALYTEEMFWDVEKEILYSESYTRIHNDNNILYGKRGFQSNQDLSNWQLIGSSGTINVQNEE